MTTLDLTERQDELLWQAVSHYRNLLCHQRYPEMDLRDFDRMVRVLKGIN